MQPNGIDLMESYVIFLIRFDSNVNKTFAKASLTIKLLQENVNVFTSMLTSNLIKSTVSFVEYFLTYVIIKTRWQVGWKKNTYDTQPIRFPQTSSPTQQTDLPQQESRPHLFMWF